MAAAGAIEDDPVLDAAVDETLTLRGEAHLIADSPITGFEPALRIVNQPNKIQLGLFAP